MDKNENTKKVEQYRYTYVVRYKYHEDGFETIGYYCSDSDTDLTKEIEVHFEIEEGDEYEIIYEVANDFNLDDYLSDTIVYLLKGDSKVKDNDYAKYHIAYIQYICNNCFFDKDKGSEYKKNVLSSVLKNLDLRKRSPMVKYVAYEILKIFNIQKDCNLNVRKQIELILDIQANGDIIYQLTTPYYIKSVQHHLDRIGNAYKIFEEKSQYRIGVLFLRIHKAFSENRFLKPKFVGDKGGIRNYTKFVDLLASYYGIDPPTYREKVLRDYIEKGERHTLYSTIKQEHNDVWISLM